MTAPGLTRTVTCRGCGGTAPARPDAAPVGWYSLTVALPPEHRGGNGREYAWIGLFCCMSCLLGHGDAMLAAEALARQTYQAVIPEPAAAGNYPGRGKRRRP